MKINNLKKYILIGVCAVLAVSSVFMTVETATSGVEVSSLRNKEIALASQKRDLEDSLIKNMSVQNLQQESSTMGYIKPATLVYVAPPQPVAAKLP